MDSGQNPVETMLWAHFVGKEAIRVDLDNWANEKIRDPTCHFGGKVKQEGFIPESIVSNMVESFFYVKKSSHYMFSPLETFHNGLGKPEEMIVSRLILSET